ncbi:MAG: hypothetical protein QXI16_06525 [Sulfolobaceae archaeon]
MNVLEFRKKHVELSIYEYLPVVIKDVAEKLESPVEYIKKKSIQSSSLLRGFHVDNIVVFEVKFKGRDALTIWIPVPDELDLFTIVDTRRILIFELLDDIYSVRQTSNLLSVRFQFINALQSNENGFFENLGCSLYSLYQYYFTEDELREMNIYFSTEEKPNLHPVNMKIKNKDTTIYTSIPVPNMSAFQKTLFNSFVYQLSKSNTSTEKLKQLESYVDPITKLINNINSFKDILKLAYDDFTKQSLSDLVGTNLRYKRIRNEELIIRTVYLKLLELTRFQKKQVDLRYPHDYLLRQMFTNVSLIKIFEYIDLRNVFQEMSLKHKLVLLIDHLPNDLRDVHSSYFQRICALDTSDDDTIGSRLQLTPDAEITEFGRFL